MSKEKETKEPKHRPEALRQPQKKDSLSSVLSWAGLQTKPGSPRSTVNSATSSQKSPSQPSPGTGTGTTVKSRRHSHGPEVKKARKGSTLSRRLSFSNIGGTQEQEGASAKTRYAKTIPTGDSKTTETSSASSGTKTSKSSSTEKINKQTQDTSRPEGHAENSQNKKPTSDTGRARSASISERPTSPKIIPKSILRVASPDGYRPPRRIVAYPAPIPNLLSGQPNSTDQAPLSPLQQILPDITEDSAPGSPPTSPISRPLSPGATVRFAKATVHRVEVGPGRRFAPVKRKSKSTITYIAPLDTGTQKGTPKGILTSPTKLRRHVANQKAMGRYWMRTEEEEAQERAEAAMKAAEEAERYRAEPASPPGPSVLANSPAFHGFSWADGLEASLDRLPPVDSLPSLDNLEAEEDIDKLEIEVSDSDDSDDSDTDSPEAGAKLLQDEEQDDDGESLAISEEKNNQVKDETNSSEKLEPGRQGDDEVIPSSSAEMKTGAGTQEVKNTVAPVTTATQEAKTATSRPAIETSSPNPTTAKNPVQNLVTVNPRAAETIMQKQAKAKKANTPAPAPATKPTTNMKSAAQGGKTEGNTTTKPPLIKLAAAATTTMMPSQTIATTPTLIITPSSPPPQRTLSPSPRRYRPPMSMTLKPTSIYLNPGTTASISSNVGGEKQPTTAAPARSSASHLRLSGRRGRRFDTMAGDHGKQGHEITA